MRAQVNQEKIKRRAKMGQLASWAGLAVLAVGMVISFRANPGAFSQVAPNDSTVLERVSRDISAIGFADFVWYEANEGQVRGLSIEGIAPSAESIASGEYPLAGPEGAVVVVTNNGNDWIRENDITLEQLAMVFSTELTRWSEVDSSWPNRDIKRHIPGTETPAFALFVDKVMRPAHGERGGQVLLETRNPDYNLWIMASFACLILGFIAANVGGYNMRRFGRSPRPDERLEKALKGFDDRYVLFSWMLPAAYVFAGPSGIYTFAVREQGGKISNVGDRWKQPFSIFRVLTAFGQEGLGNPTMESIDDAKKMRNYLKSHLPDLDVEVQPIVLFLNPKVELELQSPAVPVVDPKGLKAVLRQRAKLKRLDNDTLQKIEELFSSTPK